jgi:3-methyl-2-oxobutanoate hydroxymethyltransferase
MTKITINNILKKKGKKPIICLTAYSKAVAEILDKYCDIILVGDSLGMVLYGMKSTKEVNLNTMLLHGKTVKKYAKRSLVAVDMPYKTYSNKLIAYKNAKKIINFTKCDAVKLEGGKKISKIIKYLTSKGIPVMGHIGLLPQNASKFKLRGKTEKEKNDIINDAISVFKSGAFAVVIECVVESLAKKITNIIPIPTIGIGASKFCDGQILVTDDMLGLSEFEPKFVKKYSKIRKLIKNSVKKYCKDIKLKKFPSPQHVYNF